MITAIYKKTNRGTVYVSSYRANTREYHEERALPVEFQNLPYADLDSSLPLHEATGPHAARAGWNGWTDARADNRNGDPVYAEALELEWRKNIRYEHDHWMNDDGEIKSFGDHRPQHTCWKDKAGKKSHQYSQRVCHISD